MATFLRQQFGRSADPDLERFFQHDLGNVLRAGLCLFLLDGFDEIPDVLSAFGRDDAIRVYSDALVSLCTGNRCVIASRDYRSPSSSATSHPWSIWRILPMSLSRQEEFITKSLAQSNPELVTLIRQHVLGQGVLKAQTSNPLFLKLLCEYYLAAAPSGNFEAPTPTEVFRQLFLKRFRDAGTSSDLEQMLARASKLAYCMTNGISNPSSLAFFLVFSRSQQPDVCRPFGLEC